MNLRQRIFAGIGITMGVIVAVLLLSTFVFQRGGEKETGDTKENEQIQQEAPLTSSFPNTQDASLPPLPSPPEPPKEENRDERAVEQTARMFVERFGSYSNQNDNAHIALVLPLVTATMRQWIETQTVNGGSDYVGQTTRLVASSIVAMDANRATVHVDVQEQKEMGKEKKTSYRSGRVELAKVGSVWKVDGLYWEK